MDDQTSITQPTLTDGNSVGGTEISEKHHHAPDEGLDGGNLEQSPAKRRRLHEFSNDEPEQMRRPKGVAPIKPEFLLPSAPKEPSSAAAETIPKENGTTASKRQNDQKKGKKQKGQNTKRDFGSSRDAIALCQSRANYPEFSPRDCSFGETCKFEHDLRKYLKDGKRADLETFGGRCPVWVAKGSCRMGWRCRFAGSHSEEVDTADGRRELVLVTDSSRILNLEDNGDEFQGVGVVNSIQPFDRVALRKHQVRTPSSDKYLEWLSHITKDLEAFNHSKRNNVDVNRDEKTADQQDTRLDGRAQYQEAPFRPSEKRHIYYSPETPILAPLTTQGNLPYRRLCVELGAQVTWSEMAMSLPLLQGEKSEWALMKAHESELSPPNFSQASGNNIIKGYDNSKDFKFGAQIAANKPWTALKATELLTKFTPRLRAIDLNCGCPIDLVYRQGAGSALLEQPAKLEKILRGMNTLSGEIPITVKIRTGVKDDKPTSHRLVDRLAFGSAESLEASLGPSGAAAVTLHGRSRQQRYTKSADWEYIAECASIIKNYNEKRDSLADTIREPDQRDLAPQDNGRMYFIGNGDCYSHIDYYNHIESAQVDSVMVARGALIKPWIFEEIEKGQYLDKSASERLSYIEKFARYGLQTWGSDEIGVGVTRKFLLEWLSFACRYVPIGLLEHLPPRIQDRPPAYRGRDDLETLLSSPNYKDWIKISEMFLGPAAPGFKFEPKHKSNAYEETEG